VTDEEAVTDEEIVIAIETAVRSVTGVTTVYSALPPVARSARQLTSGAVAVPLVALTRKGADVAVTVNVGVGTSATGNGQAPVTAAAVAAAVRVVLDAAGVPDAEVAVRVSRIHD